MQLHLHRLPERRHGRACTRRLQHRDRDVDRLLGRVRLFHGRVRDRGAVLRFQQQDRICVRKSYAIVLNKQVRLPLVRPRAIRRLRGPLWRSNLGHRDRKERRDQTPRTGSSHQPAPTRHCKVIALRSLS